MSPILLFCLLVFPPCLQCWDVCNRGTAWPNASGFPHRAHGVSSTGVPRNPIAPEKEGTCQELLRCFFFNASNSATLLRKATVTPRKHTDHKKNCKYHWLGPLEVRGMRRKRPVISCVGLKGFTGAIAQYLMLL